MTSNHYAMTYSHEYNWAILIAISLAGALIRIYFVGATTQRACASSYRIDHRRAFCSRAVAALITPRANASSGDAVAFDDVRAVVHHRCTTCHSAAADAPGISGSAWRCCAGHRCANRCGGAAHPPANGHSPASCLLAISQASVKRNARLSIAGTRPKENN